jgi:hypothetical protein
LAPWRRLGADPPELLVGIKGAGHLDFGGARVSNRKLLGGPPSSAEVRKSDPVIGTVNRCCIAFFRRHLLGDRSSEEVLTTEAPSTSLLRAEPRGHAKQQEPARE